MRRQLVRRLSKSARFAQATGFFSLLLAVIATLMFRQRSLDEISFLIVMLVAAACALLALLFGMAGLWKLWNEGAKAGGASLRGMAMASLTLAPFAVAGALLAVTPALSDITTDLADPPAFPIGARVILPVNFQSRTPQAVADVMQAQAYPDLASRILAVPPAEALDAVNAAAKALGWTPTANAGSLDSPKGALRAFEAHSFVFGFTDDVVVRLRGEGERLVLDVRSASRFGGADLGANARRIRAFQLALDEALRPAKR